MCLVRPRGHSLSSLLWDGPSQDGRARQSRKKPRSYFQGRVDNRTMIAANHVAPSLGQAPGNKRTRAHQSRHVSCMPFFLFLWFGILCFLP